MVRTLHQNKVLHSLISELKLTDDKADLVYEATKGRTTSSALLSEGECKHLIEWLNTKKTQARINQDDVSNTMRRKILSICHEMQWHDAETNEIDWGGLNNWLLKYGYLHKLLHEYTAQELPKLITQFEELLRHYYQKH
jgi:hypothetical protein